MPYKKIFSAGLVGIVALFTCGAFGLIAFAGMELWQAFVPDEPVSLKQRFNAVLEAVAMLTIALAALELAETIIDEGFKRETQVSAPARVRRVLGRFLVVVVVSLSIESLVAVFQFVHDDPAMLPSAAAIAVGAAAILIAWGVFLRTSKASE